MGTVIRFPLERLSKRPRQRPLGPATVTLLPVVRIERWNEGPQSLPRADAATFSRTWRPIQPSR